MRVEIARFYGTTSCEGLLEMQKSGRNWFFRTNSYLTLFEKKER